MGCLESRQSVSLILPCLFLLSRLSFLPSCLSFIYIVPHYKHSLPFAVVFLHSNSTLYLFYGLCQYLQQAVHFYIYICFHILLSWHHSFISLLILLSLSAPLKHPLLQHLHPISSLSLSLTLSLALSLWDALALRLQIIAAAFTERQISMKRPH